MTDKTFYDQMAELDKQIEEGLLAEAELDEEITRLISAQTEESKPRFVTSHDIVTRHLQVEWADPSELPKRKTTHDLITETLFVPWVDPASLPKTKPTTFDDVTATLHPTK